MLVTEEGRVWINILITQSRNKSNSFAAPLTKASGSTGKLLPRWRQNRCCGNWSGCLNLLRHVVSCAPPYAWPSVSATCWEGVSIIGHFTARGKVPTLDPGRPLLLALSSSIWIPLQIARVVSFLICRMGLERAAFTWLILVTTLRQLIISQSK